MTDAKPQDIYVRAHTVQLEKKERKSTREVAEPKWPMPSCSIANRGLQQIKL